MADDFSHLAELHKLGDEGIPAVEAYGIEPDDNRIHYYRELWHLES